MNGQQQRQQQQLTALLKLRAMKTNPSEIHSLNMMINKLRDRLGMFQVSTIGGLVESDRVGKPAYRNTKANNCYAIVR